MPINKVVERINDAVEEICDDATLMVSGFGDAGSPVHLLEELAQKRLRGLTVIANNAGGATGGLSDLLGAGSVRKIICSYPRMAGSKVFDGLYAAKKIELELSPQGNLSERIRAGGAGIPAFFTATGAYTNLAIGKEQRDFEGRTFVLEHALRADFALIGAWKGDRWGNLTYRKAARNFGPTMAMAADVTIAEVSDIVPLGQLGPEEIVTPGLYVEKIVKVDSCWP